MHKKRNVGFVSAIIVLIQILSCGLMVFATETSQTESNLSAFFELPLAEIETKYDADVTQRDAEQVRIILAINKAQVQKQLSDLAVYKDQPDISFRKVYFDLMLEKMCLTGIYDVCDPDYRNTQLPGAWINENEDPFVLEEFDDDDYAHCWISLRFEKEFSLEYKGESVLLSPYEAAMRSLYVIDTYGDKQYFTFAFDDLRGKYIGGKTPDDMIDGQGSIGNTEKITDPDTIMQMARIFWASLGIYGKRDCIAMRNPEDPNVVDLVYGYAESRLYGDMTFKFLESRNVDLLYSVSNLLVNIFSPVPEDFPTNAADYPAYMEKMKAYTLGDLTENGTVQLDDALKALKAYTVTAGQAESGLSETQSYAADVDGSGDLTLSDAQNILRYYTLNTLGQGNVDWVDIVMFGA